MKIRNKNETYLYIKYLESAIDKAEQAIDDISYISYPEINQRTITKLKKAVSIMNDALEACAFKP